MCHVSAGVWCATAVSAPEVAGRSILEVGSCNVNGSARPFFESLSPSEYVGVDIASGPGVDVVCDATALEEKFGRAQFDVVVSTEMMEHVRDWRLVLDQMKAVCRPGGLLVITTRSRAFPYHAHPSDHWRYELDDFRAIFAGNRILKLEQDPQAPGVFIKCQLAGPRPSPTPSRDLFNIVLGRRSPPLPADMFDSRHYRQRARHQARIILAWEAKHLLQEMSAHAKMSLVRPDFGAFVRSLRGRMAGSASTDREPERAAEA